MNMLHKFSAKNFYSFKDTVEIKFEVNDKAPNTYAYIDDINETRVSKVLTVVGANASGKTNLLKILSFLRQFIIYSYDYKPDEEIPYHPYRFTSDEPTEFSVTFSCNKNLYEYYVKMNAKLVLDEALRKYNSETKQFYIVFKRSWDFKHNDYKYNLANFPENANIKKIVGKRKNASLISVAAQLDNPLSNEIIGYWKKYESNIFEFGKHDHHDSLQYAEEIAEYFSKDHKARELVEKLLTRFDLGLTRLEIEKRSFKSESGKEKLSYRPKWFHKDIKGEFDLPFLYESHGTKCLFSRLGEIIPVLFDGGIAVLDELDADLHPHMLPELMNLFLSKELNQKNAQLIFTSHHHEILNKLDKYQIVLTQRDNESGGTEAWRLDEIKGVRADDNYYAKYIAGVFGGVPEL